MACHDLHMLPCAAYLRVYEPLSAFGPAERAQWAAYAASAQRPRRASALAAEHAEALRRLIALPPIVAPAQESGHAYVRWANGITYICPWQTRLRSWLALSKLRATAGPLMSDAFAPRQAERAAEDFARWEGREGPPHVYIQTGAWSVPLAWFVPFAPTERWLVLGTPTAGDSGKGRLPLPGPGRWSMPPRCPRRAGGLPGRWPRPGGFRAAAARNPSRPRLPCCGSATSWRRLAAGLRSSIRTRWWNLITGGWFSCSMTMRCAATSPPPRSRQR